MALDKRGYLIMVVKTKCKNCKEYHYSYCNMCCSVKGKREKLPDTLTKWSIKKCIESNIGIFVNYNYIVAYSKELLEYINI